MAKTFLFEANQSNNGSHARVSCSVFSSKLAVTGDIAELCTAFPYDKNKTIDEENFMNFVAVAIVSAIVLGHSLNKRADI